MTTTALGVACVSLILSMIALGISVSTARRPARRPTQLEPRPICGCEHHASFHDDEGCHYIDLDPYNRTDRECGCKKYMGPEPLPEAYLP
jgi:hypothetical protein